MHRTTKILLSCTLGFLSLLAGCSSSNSGNGTVSAAKPTATLAANPASITSGQQAILSFTSTNADQGSIDNNIGPVGANGSVTVMPTTTTTYTFTATGAGGNATAQATVTVTPAPPVTATLSANPTTVTVGQKTKLSFTSTNATQGTIDNGVGPVGTNGSVIVTPSATTTYKFTATGAGGTAAASATVTVSTTPIVTATLTADPGVIFPGQSTTLNFSSTDATSGTINGTAVGTSGSLQESPARTTTYTYVVSGADGSASATATVTVGNFFEGLNEANAGGSSAPDIDPNGAVGQTQFMEYVNSEFQAYDKTFQTAVYASPQPIGTLWQAAGIAQCSGNNITIDAVINYDRLASRWVVAAKAYDGTHYYFCIAVSNQDDLKSASWYAYDFDLTTYLNNGHGGLYLPDWPRLGTWSDAYYATMDLVDSATSTESGVLACALDRADILNNAPMKTPQCFSDTSSLLSNGIYLGHSLIPADVDGTTAPPAGRDEFMVSIQNPVNDGSTTTSSTINLWDFHVDWTPSGVSTFTLMAPVTVPTYTPGCYLYKAGLPGYTNCVPEPISGGVPQFVDSVGDRFMPRFAYRNLPSYESYLVSHTISKLPNATDPWQTGIRWYELRDNGSGTPSLNQSGLVNPDNSLYRFLPSIAQDKDGNVAVGYSTSSTSTAPAINFSYWNLGISDDTPIEAVIINGTNGEEVTSGTGVGPWGSYSSMTVDPSNDCTFWYVNEYWVPSTASYSWATGIASFQIPGCQ